MSRKMTFWTFVAKVRMTVQRTTVIPTIIENNASSNHTVTAIIPTIIENTHPVITQLLLLTVTPTINENIPPSNHTVTAVDCYIYHHCKHAIH